MLKYSPVLLLVACSTALINPKPLKSKSERIIGAVEASARSFPWQAALFISTTNGRYFCSGTLVSTLHVITTGSCLETSVTGVEIHVGTIYSDKEIWDGNRRILASDNLLIHPDFDGDVFRNDIGFVQFRETLGLTDSIHLAFLKEEELEVGTSVTVAGWGQTSDDDEAPVDQLGYVQLVTISNEECRVFYGDIINENIVCAVGNNNEGTCNGDTGDPVVTVTGYRPHITAIANFISGNGCETPEPSGFLRLHPYHQWINSVIETRIKEINDSDTAA